MGGLDTSAWDAKISDLNTQIPAAQQAVDTDLIGQQINALKAKSDALKTLKDQLGIVTAQKNQAVTLQAQIDANTQQIATLKSSI